MRDVLLDRDPELAALGRQLATVRARTGLVVVVEGPAGIGKSSLLANAARVAEAGGFVVLRARGGPLEQDATWGVARQLFAPVRAARTGMSWRSARRRWRYARSIPMRPSPPRPATRCTPLRTG